MKVHAPQIAAAAEPIPEPDAIPPQMLVQSIEKVTRNSVDSWSRNAEGIRKGVVISPNLMRIDRATWTI